MNHWTLLSMSHSTLFDTLSVQVFLLQNYFRVSHLWEGNTHYDNASSSIVRKIKTFTNPTTANSHQDSTILGRGASFKDSTVVPIHNHLILNSLLGFSVYDFVLLNLIENT